MADRSAVGAIATTPAGMTGGPASGHDDLIASVPAAYAAIRARLPPADSPTMTTRVGSTPSGPSTERSHASAHSTSPGAWSQRGGGERRYSMSTPTIP